MHHRVVSKTAIVSPRYSSFKEEILHYRFLSDEAYQNEILPKAESYLKSETAKSITALGEHFTAQIHEDDSLQVKNLISLILYCDYTNLSSDFTKSFRKMHQFELIHHVKKRNAAYFYWSKTLIETVQCYGHTGYDRNNMPALTGPFFTGMSVVLNISQFNINLVSPTSTSKQIAVALKFSGVIILSSRQKNFSIIILKFSALFPTKN